MPKIIKSFPSLSKLRPFLGHGVVFVTVIFRSTSESRPNNIEGENVRPPVRPSVRPSVHKKFLQFE